MLFGTTELFLEKLGLNGLDELPALGEFVPGSDVLEALERGLRVTDDEDVAVELDDDDDADATDDDADAEIDDVPSTTDRRSSRSVVGRRRPSISAAARSTRAARGARGARRAANRSIRTEVAMAVSADDGERLQKVLARPGSAVGGSARSSSRTGGSASTARSPCSAAASTPRPT